MFISWLNKCSCIKSVVPSSACPTIVDDDKSERSAQVKSTNRLLNIHLLDSHRVSIFTIWVKRKDAELLTYIESEAWSLDGGTNAYVVW